MTANAVPTPTAFPIQFGQRDAKVIETATLAAGTLSNKTIDSSCTFAGSLAASTIKSTSALVDATDITKTIKWSLSGATAGADLTLSSSQTADRTLTIPVLGGADTLMTLGLAQTVTGVLTFNAAPVISSITNGAATLTLPTSTATLATLGLNETVSGVKTYSAANIHFATMTIVDAATNPKAIGFSVSGATASTKTTIAVAQAGNIQVTLPAHTCVMPAADGTAGQVLQTNGSGVWSFASSVAAEKTATITITEANLVAMNGAVGGDKELVAAQAGIVYVPTMIQIFADYDTAEYTNGDDLVLVGGTVASGQVWANIDKTAFIPGTTADAHCVVLPEMLLGSATSKGVIITGLANAPLSLNIKTGGTQFTDPGTAQGTFKVKVHYREIALLT